MMPNPQAIRAMVDAQRALLQLEKTMNQRPPNDIQMRQLAEAGAMLHQLLTKMAAYL